MRSDAHKVLLELLSDVTGFPNESLGANCRLIDDLNLDSIKAGGLLAEAKLRLGIAGATDTSRYINADIQTIAAALNAAQPACTAACDARSTLYDLICGQTGFDRSSLSEDQRLLDDLNLDSIKAAALIAELLVSTGTQGVLAPGEWVNARLGDLADRVQAAAGTGQPEQEAPAQRAGSRWVRAFTVGRTRQISEHTPVVAGGFPAGTAAVLGDSEAIFSGRLAAALNAARADALLQSDTVAVSPCRILVVPLPRATESEAAHSAMDGIYPLQRFARFAHEYPAAFAHLQTVIFVQCPGDSRSRAAGPSAKAFAASLQLERPAMEVVVVEVQPQHEAELVARVVVAEARNESGYRFVAIDGEGQCWTEHAEPVVPEECLPRHLHWSARDVVLVTGGGKGITAECALALAQQKGVTLALVGRSPMPLSNDTGELANCLRRLRTEGVRFRYYQADVADGSALSAVIARVRAELGPITGVLHGAGTNQPRAFDKVTAEEAYQEIAPKLLGAENLMRLLADAPPKLFAALTSIIGVTGMGHNAWYAYSNEATARLLASYGEAHPATAVVSFAYGVWDEVGMGVKLGSVKHLEQIGVQPIAVSEGVRHFLQWLETAPPQPEVIVTANVNQLPTWRSRTLSATGYRYEGTPLLVEPGVERVTRVVLDAQKELYLHDHNFRGTLLLPTVMGLEAMAQAALSAIDRPGLRVVSMESIRLDQPIVVPADRPIVIEIRALVRERTSPLEPWVVEASIGTEQSGFEQAHFAARILLETAGRRCGEFRELGELDTLDILPGTDLYGSILFQGPLFQRLSAVEALDGSHMRFLTHATSDGARLARGYADASEAELVLGDAYYRDSLLQAAQIPLSPELCLPIYIDRIEFLSDQPLNGTYRADARIVQRHDKRVGVEVTVHDQTGLVVERIIGYEVQVVERRDDLPSPEALLRMAHRPEQSALDQVLAKLEDTLHVATPACVLRHMPALQTKPRQDRRAQELPVFKMALKAAGARLGIDTAGLQVRWLHSGKPVCVSGEDALEPQTEATDPGWVRAVRTEIDLSLSHDGDFTLCSAGQDRQGVDLVAPQRYSREKWYAMFDRQHLDTLARLEADGDSLDRAGARLWAALEALIKASGDRAMGIRVVTRSQDGVLFSASTPQGELSVVTSPCRFNDTEEYMVAIVVKRLRLLTEHPGTTLLAQGPSAGSLARNERRLDEQRTANRLATASTVQVRTGGPAVRPALSPADIDGSSGEFRFLVPLSFKDGCNPDGSFGFVRTFEWMGRLREAFLEPVLPQLKADFTSRRYAWVTNRSFAMQHSPVYAGELLEVAGKFLDRAGPNDATVKLRFDWYRADSAAQGPSVATSEIEMTWAETLAHGVVRPAAYPAYLDRFLSKYSPSDAVHEDRTITRQRAIGLLGAAVWRAPQTPGAGLRLQQAAVQTSQNDANLVGNVYYTKYYELQSQLVDGYLYELLPESYTSEVDRGMRCLFATVDHLRDAMPFDRVSASMRLTAIYERGVEVTFDFLRLLPDGGSEKLAVGSQLVSWVDQAVSRKEPRYSRLPTHLANHFLNLVSGSAERHAA
jgi:NAD(P)-dependent dehydrogenase (short-subunit alcohol dehydrogenase family)/acyl-CoA thioesterase FadM/phosphopantetheinyl transferase